ncbi:hypothetical protein EUA06_19530 [Nocardioides glacieisoli]|uniref:Uncharacterized protein n=1 Tax=Nocardioides glacieisoli TaxID=1168730 RepID=A0A4Q2RK04_9ACTN|nr:hypothetical protein [Nocardioides glacieisoli]RYB88688.1 hypothetical protein EUA06_19530 [Nocardioides glacieisoli]
MSDLDQLDRAFESLTRDLAHTHGPGAAAAMATARARRRTKVGAVALATALVVGGGLTVPRLLFPADGLAARGGEARFDAVHLEDATSGWTSGWEDWQQYSPKGGGSFSPPECSSMADPFADTGPAPTFGGSSLFVGDELSNGRFALARYADAASAATAQTKAYPAPDTCGTTTTYDVDGVEVRHDSMPNQDPADTGSWLGDIWSARIGAERAEFQVYGRAGVADPASAERVAQLLVAGLRDGWTQSGMDEVPRVPPGNGKGPLPEWTGIDLEGALAGWRSPTKRAATTSPNLLCLDDHLNGPTSATSAAGGSPHGLSYRIAGYDEPDGGTANVEVVLDELRACTSTEVTIETLPNGVHVATYDTGGPEPENAIWLAANGDRAGMVAVERADRPLPESARQDVADALHEILHLRWE